VITTDLAQIRVARRVLTSPTITTGAFTMQTLSITALDTVTGGTPTFTPTSGSSGNNDQILTTLQSIQSSIKDLGNNQNQGLFGGSNGALLMMTMAFAMSRREVVVYGGGGHHWWHHGW
jgi:hypothetical protein